MPLDGLVFNTHQGDTYVSSVIPEDATCTLTIEGGVDTSISTELDSNADGLFDLQGRKINHPIKKGIYIEDGQKVLK